jgi:hypothetical protein
VLRHFFLKLPKLAVVGLGRMANKPKSPAKSSPQPKLGGKGKLGVLLGVAGVGLAAMLALRLKPEPPPEVDTKRAADLKGEFAAAPTRTRVNSKPAETRGAYAADEMMQVAGRGGTVVVVREVPGFGVSGNSDLGRFLSMISSEAEAFKDRLDDKGKFTFLPDLELPRADGTTRTQWPVGVFAQFLQKTPPSAAIVLFCQLPAQLTEAEKGQLRSRPGRVVVVAGSESEMRPLVEQRLVHLAVTSRVPIPPPAGNAPETPMQWVARVHVVLR